MVWMREIVCEWVEKYPPPMMGDFPLCFWNRRVTNREELRGGTPYTGRKWGKFLPILSLEMFSRYIETFHQFSKIRPIHLGL